MPATARMLTIIEHVSLDGVAQHSTDENSFPYNDWTPPYGDNFDLLLGRRTHDLWSHSGPGRRAVPSATA